MSGYPSGMEQPEVDLSTIEFDHEELRVFWELARYHAKLNAAPTYFGPTTLESVPPPAWAYGDSAAESDAFVARVLADDGGARVRRRWTTSETARRPASCPSSATARACRARLSR